VETTENQEVEFDGTIEGAVASIIEPEEDLEAQDELPEEESEESDEDDEAPDDDSDEDDESDEETDDSEDDEDTEDAAQEGQSFTVKVDGQEVAVTLDELKQGYSGQKYVQRGMQEAATQRKQAEEVYNALLNERQNIAQMYQQIQSGGMMQAPQQPSRELFDTDPIGYMDAKLKYDDDVAAYSGQMQQLEAVTQQQSQAQQAATQAYLHQELETLKQQIPEFSDEKKASAVRDKMLAVGSEVYGYQPEEIGQVMDSRAIRVLHDAMKYREIMNGKKAAEDKANPAKRRSRTVKAGAKPTNSSKKATEKRRSKLKSSGSIEDALSLILKN
tara:strand:+ start:2359 stop:3348 length:990 start_codon:yes stop_codon:yes gene_type:complete